MKRGFFFREQRAGQLEISIAHCEINWIIRLLAILGVALFHSACYYLVNLFNSLRPSSVLLDLRIPVDDKIPFLPWTWVFYYLGDVYIILGASFIVWNLPKQLFRLTIYAYSGMILTGALIQIALPAQAPWPSHLSQGQEFFHNLISMRPYACLPSMHVALAFLPTAIGFSVLHTGWLKIAILIFASLITISTLTLKEHYFLDALTGLILAFLFYAAWLHKSKKLEAKL